MWVCFHDDSKINKTREVKRLIQAERLEKSSVWFFFFQTHKFKGQNNFVHCCSSVDCGESLLIRKFAKKEFCFLHRSWSGCATLQH